MTMQMFRANVETAFGYESGYLGPDILGATLECVRGAKDSYELQDTSLLTECLYVLVFQGAYFARAVDSLEIGQQLGATAPIAPDAVPPSVYILGTVIAAMLALIASILCFALCVRPLLRQTSVARKFEMESV